MTDTPALKPDTINTHIANVYPALALLAGMQLEVFTPLATGPMQPAALAAALGVNDTKLTPLLYALVTTGLLTVHDGVFANTPEANEFLVKGKPRYLGGSASAYADLWSATLHTAESVRTGVPQVKHDFSRMTHAELTAFIRGIDAGATATARRLHKDYDLAAHRRLLDAGGGAGGLAMALCRLCPALQATVAELPNVARITRECIAENRMEERVTVLETDLTEAPPTGTYDLIVMRSLLQVLSADAALTVVKNAVRRLAPGGRVFMIGRMLDDSRLSPLDAVAVNVMFVNVYDHGQAYTEAEYRGWFAAAELKNVQRQNLAGGYSILTGER